MSPFPEPRDGEKEHDDGEAWELLRFGAHWNVEPAPEPRVGRRREHAEDIRAVVEQLHRAAAEAVRGLNRSVAEKNRRQQTGGRDPDASEPRDLAARQAARHEPDGPQGDERREK